MFKQPTFLIVIGSVIGLLAFFTILGAILKRRAKSPEAVVTIDNLNARVRAWWGMVALFGGAVVFGPTVTLVFFGLLSFMAFREFITLTPTRFGDHRALFVAFFIVIPLQ